MTLLAGPFLALIRHTPELRRGTTICVLLSLVASGAEIAVAVSVLPLLASLGMSTGSKLQGLVGSIPPIAWLVLFAIAAACRSGANWLAALKTETTTQALVVSLQTRIYRALAAAHWDTARRLSPPTITSALQTQTYDAGYGFSDLVQVIAAALLIFGYLASAALVFPLILPAILALLAVIWWLNARHSERVRSYSADYVDATTELHQRYEDWVAIGRIVSLGVDAKSLADRFESGARDAASHSIGYTRAAAATQMSYDAALIAAILLGIPIAWWLDTPPALLAFGLIALVRVLPRASSIQSGYQGIINVVAPLQAVESLAEELERDPVARPTELKPLNWQHLQIKGAGVAESLGNDEARWILRYVDLELRHGEWLGVNGPTGAGKTTLAEVLLMLMRTDAGELRIDGRVTDETLASRWREQAAYVPQDVVLFDATIRENLRLYAPGANDAELKAALEQAAGEFVIERLPEGLDSRAGPGGRWLSGGERQRIGIARALVKKPGLLVLDEPTAALDTETQEKLMDALSELEHTMSVVLITHRPELLRLADRVISVVDGRVAV